VTDTAQRGPATVVIAQRIKPGREADVRRWQEDVNRAVAVFPGYLGSDVAGTAGEGNGDAGDWTVIYRFDSRPHLIAWLGSPERDEILGRGAGLFDGQPAQHVLIRDPAPDQVTVVVSHPVSPADEEEFLAWQQRVTDAERQFPGFRGAELFRPVPGVQDDWTALYQYDTDEHVSAWLESPERRRLLEEGRRFEDFDLRRIAAPFGSWFARPDEAADGAANWKTALSVLVGLYPTVVLLTLAISEIWPAAQLWIALLIGNICSVALLTWVVMPVVTRALNFWLAPEDEQAGRRTDALGTIASVAFLTLAALVFWLITTQIWHLP
jgi:uncharacterized protein